MEGGLERNNSMYGKDSIISKRKKIAIITALVIVVLVVVIGLAVGVSQKKDHSSKSTGAAPPASVAPTAKPITTNPGDITGPARSLSLQRQTVLARSNNTVTAATLDKFLETLEEVASNLPLVTLDIKHNISSRSLLMYLRDANIEAVLTPLVDFANSTSLSDLSPAALSDLVSAVKKLLNPNAIKEWGKLLAAGHKGNMSSTVLSAEAMLKAAAGKGVTLPTTTVTKEAIAKAKNWTVSSTASQTPGSLGRRRLVQEDKVARLARKLMAEGDSFQEACIPIVFHVLQCEYQGALFPGEGYGAASASNLVDRLNLAFANEEWSTAFRQDPADTMISFRVEAVLESPVDTPYLGVSVDQWALCADDMDLMVALTQEASKTYPNNQYINVIICGDPGDGSGVLGYAFVPDGDDLTEDLDWPHIFLRYDEFSVDFNNNDDAFNRGGWTFAHEIGHHLGLHHPHPGKDDAECEDGDDLEDTAPTGVVQVQDYYYDLNELCDYWRVTGKWAGTSSYGLTLADMSSCPPTASIDPVFNIMEYTASSCYSYFTPQQVAYLQYAVTYFRPQLYDSAIADSQCAARK